MYYRNPLEKFNKKLRVAPTKPALTMGHLPYQHFQKGHFLREFSVELR